MVRDASFVEGYGFCENGPPMKCLIGDGLGVINIGGGQDYFTGNVFRDYKQGFSGFKGSQG